MKNFVSIFISLIIIVIVSCNPPEETQVKTNMNMSNNFGIVIHGGAGTILKKNLTPEMEKEYTKVLNEALDKGYAILEKGGSALDAVTEAVKIMEDCRSLMPAKVRSSPTMAKMKWTRP